MTRFHPFLLYECHYLHSKEHIHCHIEHTVGKRFKHLYNILDHVPINSRGGLHVDFMIFMDSDIDFQYLSM